MNTAKSLQERLQREIPAFSWKCSISRPASEGHSRDAIEIRALHDGHILDPSPFSLSRELLARWGVDAAARLVGHEFQLQFGLHSRRSEYEWDKLAEL